MSEQKAVVLRKPEPQPTNVVIRDEFGAQQVQRQAETALAAVTAREEAIIKAEYVMAERHPRNWMEIRAEMLEHCKRPRFAEAARYAKPIGGREKIDGEWVDKKARGFSARFSETLVQEMGNIKPVSSVVYEDDAIRIVRIGVTDLQKNIPRSREISFAKAVERKGKKDAKSNAWTPPEGRIVISQRINSAGEPTYLCVATEDEMRSKVNSEESKTQRDFALKFCPRDILDECEEMVYATLDKEDKKDPTETLKKMLDTFRVIGVGASLLEKFIGREARHFTTKDIQDLRELFAAIRDEQTTFDKALADKYAPPESAEEEQDLVRKQKMADQAKEAREAAEKSKPTADAPKDTETPTAASGAAAGGDDGHSGAANPGERDDKSQAPQTIKTDATSGWPNRQAMMDDFAPLVRELGDKESWRIFGAHSISEEAEMVLDGKDTIEAYEELKAAATEKRTSSRPVFGGKRGK